MVNFITIRNKIINTFIIFNSLTDARKYAYLNFKNKKRFKNNKMDYMSYGIKLIVFSTVFIFKSTIKYLSIYISSLMKGYKPIIFNSMEMVVTEKCNLLCPGCISLIPLYKDRENKDIDDLSNYLSTFLDVVDYISIIKIMGGEPFLNRNLSSFLEKFCSEERYSEKFNKLVFITNGTVIPDKATLNVMGLFKDKIEVRVSNYGKKSSKIIDSLIENDVVYVIGKDSNSHWVDIGDLKRKNRDELTLNKMFSECEAKKNCNTLLDGKLYLCPFAAHGTKLGFFPDDGNFVDLSSNRNYKNLRESFYKIRSLKYIGTCDYCDIPLSKPYVEESHN